MTGCAHICYLLQLRFQLQIHILRNLGFIERECEWSDDEVIISNDGNTMI